MGMTTGKAIHAAVAAASATMAFAAFAEVIYENDFYTRTSASPVPMSEWRSCDYVTGLLANTNGAAPFANPSPSGSPQQIQDGWIKTADSLAIARVWAGTSGNDNPAVVLGHATTSKKEEIEACIVKQRLGNTFTSGTVEIQFDFLPPANWAVLDDGLRRATLSFGDEAFYSPDMAQDTMYQHTAGSVGVAIHGPEGSRKRKVYYNVRHDFGDTNMTEQVVAQGDWLRAAATIDLDARKWGFSMFAMGASQPAMDAATPAAPIYSQSNLPFADDSVTSISSIALGGLGVAWGSSSYSASRAPTHVAWFDNIRIWHNGEECYENDFATRRWRTFGGTASHTYVADTLVTNRVESEVYVVSSLANSGTSIVPARENTGTTVQTPGPDGWRRVHKDGAAQAWPRKETVGERDYTYLRFNCAKTPDTSRFAFLAHRIGTKLTSGKVRFSVDTRLPTSWAYDSSKASVLWVTLGSDSYYAGDPSKYNTYRWAAVGIRARDGENGPTYVTDSASENPSPDTGTITAGNWYRIVIEADIDAGNYIFKVYEQGSDYPDSGTANGTLIYTSPALEKKDGINSLSCFSLAAYHCPVYFDNVKIWHTPTGSATETLLYENYFTSRTIYAQDTRVAPLIGTQSLNPVGQDGWTHLYVNDPPLFIDWADGNPALTFSRYKFEIYGAQDLGQTVRTGTLVAQADMRPPRGWLQNGGSAYLRLGGDAFIQGSLLDDDDDTYFLKNLATSFGFKNMNTGKSGNLYTNSTIVAYRGDHAGGGAMEAAAVAVDTTHWYRFVATADMAKSQCNVDVYDMGATHPTLADTTPETPVATFSELPFRKTRSALGGISCVGASSDKTAQNLYDPSLAPMIDNLRVSQADAAFVITVR